MSHNAGETIDFVSEDIPFELPGPEQLKNWLTAVAEGEQAEIEGLTYIFCSDEYLLEMNQHYLEHDTYTDVITFDYAEQEGLVEGDVFISIDRVTENAETLGTTFTDELHRVMVHGLLHLLGYVDKTDADKREMSEKEDYYLSLRPFWGKDL